MAYVVIATFADLQDGKHLYSVGDTFPRAGFSVSEKRLKELAGSDNAAHKPLISAFNASESEDDKIPKPERKTRNRGVTARLRG